MRHELYGKESEHFCAFAADHVEGLSKPKDIFDSLAAGFVYAHDILEYGRNFFQPCLVFYFVTCVFERREALSILYKWVRIIQQQ